MRIAVKAGLVWCGVVWCGESLFTLLLMRYLAALSQIFYAVLLTQHREDIIAFKVIEESKHRPLMSCKYDLFVSFPNAFFPV